MGTGIILPATRISQDGVTYDSGDIRIVGGAGQQISRPLAKRYQWDATRIDAAEVFSIFSPGVISAKTLGVWGNTRASQRAIIAAMEANFGTAQTTADVNNYFALKIADSLNNNAVLPFTAVAPHFVLNKGSGQTIAQPGVGAGSVTGPDGSEHCVLIETFTPTQTLTCDGFYWRGGWCNNLQQGESRATRCTLLDANWNILATATLTTGAQTDNKLYFAFPLAVTLQSGTSYMMAIDCMAAYQNNPNTDLWYYIAGAGTQSAPITLGQRYIATASLPAGYSGTIQDAHTAGYITTGGSGCFTTGGQKQESALLGTAGGTTLSGDLTLSIVTVGTPLGTAAGSDLNARVLLNPA